MFWTILIEIPVCIGYKLDGKLIDEMPVRNSDLERVQPVIERRPGWKQSTRGISRYEDLPVAARHYLEYLQHQTGVEVGCVSTGPERNETMIMTGSRLAKLLNN